MKFEIMGPMISKVREPFNGFSHLIGAVLAVFGLIHLINFALDRGTVWHVVSFSIFGSSLVLLYLSSSLYHLLKASDRTLLLLKRIDHIMIYVTIAASFTPFCLGPLRGPWGWTMLAVMWLFVLKGFFFKIYWIHAPRWVSTMAYIIMGGIAAIALVPLARATNVYALIWLLLSALSYFIGALIYASKRPDPFPGLFGFHEIWHIFVLLGSTFNFVSVVNLL